MKATDDPLYDNIKAMNPLNDDWENELLLYRERARLHYESLTNYNKETSKIKTKIKNHAKLKNMSVGMMYNSIYSGFSALINVDVITNARNHISTLKYVYDNHFEEFKNYLEEYLSGKVEA